jgi:AcrR family transcriptional regulator
MTWANQYRRNEESRSAILTAALDVCASVGYAACSIEAIARSAGAGKQTIYRWWPSKGAVLLEALNLAGGDTAAFPDSGDVAADMTIQMNGVVRFWAHPKFGPVFRAVIAGAQDDPILATRLREEVIEPRRAGARRRLELARDRGEIAVGSDPHQLMELLYAPLYYRLLVTGEHLDEQYVTALVHTVLATIAAPSA